MSKTEKHLALALQGGGSHGAFTWGVLDRLLEEEKLQLEGFVGTSAGAMNATVLAYGLHKGGRQMARELLEQFWHTVSTYHALSPLRPSWIDKFFGFGNLDNTPGFQWTEMLNLFISPYQSNPSNYNPLREILTKIVDFEGLRACQATRLFVCATSVRRGRARVFSLKDISVEAVLASACLPYMFQAVTIEGEDYWDGGYMGNPPIYPLIDGTDCSDIMIVHINPIDIPETPKKANDIRDRVNELSFNSSLMLEMRKIEFIDRMLDAGIDLGQFEGRFRKIYFHRINPEADIYLLNLSSKLNADWNFLQSLKATGRRYADQWLQQHYDQIGQKSTFDLREAFL
ncbi:MAG: patatin-like phospholipase family protein [Microscillaceae bacterium]